MSKKLAFVAVILVALTLGGCFAKSPVKKKKNRCSCQLTLLV